MNLSPNNPLIHPKELHKFLNELRQGVSARSAHPLHPGGCAPRPEKAICRALLAGFCGRRRGFSDIGLLSCKGLKWCTPRLRAAMALRNTLLGQSPDSNLTHGLLGLEDDSRAVGGWRLLLPALLSESLGRVATRILVQLGFGV